VTLLGLHFLFLAFFFEPAISTPDANGYLAQARLIALEGRSDIAVESPAQYVGDHWMPAGPGRYFGQYPPGLPALLAVVFRLFGPEATLWVIPVMGSLSLLALYLVVRAWVGAAWGLLAAALMALNPFANAHALGADSHTAVCFFLMWGLFGLVQWERTRSAWWAAFSGICMGVIPSIRYPETLFLIAFACFVALSWRRSDGTRSLVAGVLGASVPILALAVRNQMAFGAFWRTGYSISGEQTGFGIGFFLRYFIPYLFLMLTIGAGAVFVVGVRGMVVLCQRPETRRRGQFLVALVLPITLLYMSYYWHPGHNSMRFLLPTSFVYTIAAIHLLQIRTQSDPARGRKLARILLAVTIVWGLPLSLFELRPLKRDNAALARVSRLLQRYVEPGSILIAQSGLQQHLDFLGGWRLAPEEAFEGRVRPPRPGGPPSFRDDEPRRTEGPAPTERSKTFRQQIARWAGDGYKVYWITTQAAIPGLRFSP
jgi:4-amino-4-deoxy-L-arabinose transferase-like glycosyltransferase